MLGIQTSGDGLCGTSFSATAPMETYPSSLPAAYCDTTLQLGMRTPSILRVNRPRVVRYVLSPRWSSCSFLQSHLPQESNPLLAQAESLCVYKILPLPHSRIPVLDQIGIFGTSR